MMLAENIRRLHKENGLSQDRLAKLADVTLTTLVKIGRNQRQPEAQHPAESGQCIGGERQ